MDMAGAIPDKGIVLNKWPELAELFAGWSQEMALEFGLEQSVNAHSDHYPFLMAGVPTGGIGRCEQEVKRAGAVMATPDTIRWIK